MTNAVLGILALTVDQLQAALHIVGGHAVQSLTLAVLHEGGAHALEEVYRSMTKLGGEVFEFCEDVVLVHLLIKGHNHGYHQEEGKNGQDDRCGRGKFKN